MDWKTTAFGIVTSVLLAGGAWADSYEPGTKPRPMNQWGCPAVIYGKWKPHSRGTKEDMGDMEIGKDWIDFSVHGRIPFRRHTDREGREYFEFLAFLKEGSRAADSGKFFRPYFPAEWQHDPYRGCSIALKICLTEKDMLKSLSGSGDVYCGTDVFTPIIDDYEIK